MVNLKMPFAFLLLLTCCSYDASFLDCEIRCTNTTGCPDGFRCGMEHLCRVNETQTCTAVLGDAGLAVDSAVVDGSVPGDAFACTTHSQCNALTPGDCCVNPGAVGHCTHGVIIGGVCDPQ
jgi:hypothetical protein